MAVYLFFDESGNLDFSTNGSRYFCFGALTLRDPGPLTAALTRVRYGFLEQGLELQCFHAAEDRQVVRNEVFDALACVGGFDFDVLVAEKSRTPAPLRDPFEFYARLGYVLVDSVLDRFRHLDEPVVVITDNLPLQRDRKALAKAFRTAIRDVRGERPFSILHHSSAAHAGLQAVDYCTWAVQRRLRGDERPYRKIQSWIRSEWEAFKVGIKKRPPQLPLRESPMGSCHRGGTFTLVLLTGNIPKPVPSRKPLVHPHPRSPSALSGAAAPSFAR